MRSENNHLENFNSARNWIDVYWSEIRNGMFKYYFFSVGNGFGFILNSSNHYIKDRLWNILKMAENLITEKNHLYRKGKWNFYFPKGTHSKSNHDFDVFLSNTKLNDRYTGRVFQIKYWHKITIAILNLDTSVHCKISRLQPIKVYKIKPLQAIKYIFVFCNPSMLSKTPHVYIEKF